MPLEGAGLVLHDWEEESSLIHVYLMAGASTVNCVAVVKHLSGELLRLEGEKYEIHIPLNHATLERSGSRGAPGSIRSFLKSNYESSLLITLPTGERCFLGEFKHAAR